MPKSPNFSQEKYIKAYHFAAKAHRGQKYSGSSLPYIIHITFVCMEMIAAMEVENVDDPDLAIQVAILHDVIEDTKISRKRLEEEFGKDVMEGVDYLTKRKKIKKEKRFSENINYLSDAPGMIKMIKLADRISNLQAPPFHWDKEKIADYLEKSKVIHKKLGDASPYLSKRLKQKIEEYEKYR